MGSRGGSNANLASAEVAWGRSERPVSRKKTQEMTGLRTASRQKKNPGMASGAKEGGREGGGGRRWNGDSIFGDGGPIKKRKENVAEGEKGSTLSRTLFFLIFGLMRQEESLWRYDKDLSRFSANRGRILNSG